MSGAGLPNNVLVTVSRIRKEAGVGDEIPVVIFCAQEVPEGEEVAIGGNVYLTNPDNFNQLRNLLARLLSEVPHAGMIDEEEHRPHPNEDLLHQLKKEKLKLKDELAGHYQH